MFLQSFLLICFVNLILGYKLQPTCSPSFRHITSYTNQTVQPSFNPSTRPSFTPSTRPSFNPSIRPSFKPSTYPSFTPSTQPSARPSTQPSARPSTRPVTKAKSNEALIIIIVSVLSSIIVFIIAYKYCKKPSLSKLEFHSNDDDEGELLL